MITSAWCILLIDILASDDTTELSYLKDSILLASLENPFTSLEKPNACNVHSINVEAYDFTKNS